LGYTLGQAAKAAGISKPTIARAIKAGKLSAARNPDGTYSIEPAELHRVWPPVTPGAGSPAGDMVSHETAALERENALLREMLEREREINRRLLDMLGQGPKLIDDRRPWWRRLWR
jgi:hypothetical protein